MASINLSGILKDPTGEVAVGDQIRFTHRTTTGDTIKFARSVLIIPPGGDYDIDLEFGNILVEYLDIKDVNYKNLGIVTVNGDSTAVTLPELLLAIVPPTDEQLLEFQNILAEAEALVAVFATTEGAENVNTNSNNSVQIELDGLTAGQIGGLIVFTTKALLDAFTPVGSPEEESSYKVTNDSTSTNNGFYHWDGVSVFVKDADLVINVIDRDNTSDAVSGFAVDEHVQQKTNDLARKTETTYNYDWSEGLNKTDQNISGELGLHDSESSSSIIVNDVFDYEGNCVKGIGSAAQSIRVQIRNLLRSEIPAHLVGKIRFQQELYLPVGMRISFNMYVEASGSQLVGTFSTSDQVDGVNILTMDIDLTSLDMDGGVWLAFQSKSGTIDLPNVRIGRTYFGSPEGGSFFGSEKDSTVISSTLDNKITNTDSFNIGVRSRYSSSDSLNVDNIGSLLIENYDEMEHLKNDIGVDSLINLPLSYPVQYTKGIEYVTPSASSTEYQRTRLTMPYKPQLVFSQWASVNNTGGSSIKVECKGFYPLAIVKTYDVSISTNTDNAIIDDIDNNGFSESQQTGYKKRWDAYFYDDNGTLFVRMHIIVDVDAPICDYFSVEFARFLHVSGQATDFLAFGFEIGDVIRSNKLPELSLLSPVTEAHNSILNRSPLDILWDNRAINLFNEAGIMTEVDGVATSFHLGRLTYGTLITKAETIETKLGKGFVYEYNNGDPIPKFVSGASPEEVFKFQLPNADNNDPEYNEGEENAHFGFWINRNELNGNGLVITSDSGATLPITSFQLACKGTAISRNQNQSISQIYYVVEEVFGEYSYIKINFETYKAFTIGSFRLSILDGGNDITQFTIYNPTCIFTSEVDPFHIYKSRAERNDSRFIGKKMLLVGDSQYNDKRALQEIVWRTGANVINANNGGHRMAINGSLIGDTNYASFYHSNLRDLVLAHTDVDVYLMTVSSNDGSGGGDSSTVATQAVIDNYPYYGDDAGTIIAKQALFDGLTSGEIDTMFAYKQTYSAYLKQLLLVSEKALIICCSVPLSVFGYLTGGVDGEGRGIWEVGESPDTARDDLDTGKQQMAADSLEVSRKHNAIYSDLLNEIGLTYENFPRYCVDGTHWDTEIKKRIGASLVYAMNKSSVANP